MTKKLLFLTLNILILFSWSFAQDHAAGWLSPRRLSLSFSTTYHFNPWNNYNNAVAQVTRQIRLDNFFHEPTGFYEKINGDVTVSVSLGYNITKNVSILFSGQLGQIDSRFEFYPDSTKLPDNLYSVAHHQKMIFDLHSLGFGLKRTFTISKQLSWFTTIGIDRYTGQLKMNWRHLRDTRGPLPEGIGQLVDAEFKKSVWGWNVRCWLNKKYCKSAVNSGRYSL